jgi:hypothetical protein
MAKAAMFTGLVFDENGHPATLAYVGENACYVVFDDDFKRHIDAELVDRQVLRFMRAQVEDSRDLAVKTMLEMMGKDDIFTKAAVESSINNMEKNVGQPIPTEARQYLGMLGFKVVIDFHGNVLDVQLPAGSVADEDE